MLSGLVSLITTAVIQLFRNESSPDLCALFTVVNGPSRSLSDHYTSSKSDRSDSSQIEHYFTCNEFLQFLSFLWYTVQFQYRF